MVMDEILAAKAISLGFSSPGKYGAIERERRWLCEDFPGSHVTRTYLIEDIYVTGSTLRLRSMHDMAAGKMAWKLSRKGDLSPDKRIITTLYLTEPEYRLMAGFPGARLRKTRHRLDISGTDSFSVDIFDGALAGLILAEAEFKTDVAMAAFAPPAFLGAEVTGDARYTGGWMAHNGAP